MDLRGCTRRKPTRRASSKSRRGGGRRSGRKSKKITLPKTAVVNSRKSSGRGRMSRASISMSLTELQFLAKDRGIPFGGLSRAKLIKKINNYIY